MHLLAFIASLCTSFIHYVFTHMNPLFESSRTNARSASSVSIAALMPEQSIMNHHEQSCHYMPTACHGTLVQALDSLLTL